MLTMIKELFANQYEAAFCTLSACVERCPDKSWNAPVARFPFSQVALHTLIFADLYLSRDEDAMKSQPYHREHPSFFGQYEQLLDQEPTEVYERAAIKSYLEFCRARASAVTQSETVESLAVPCGFPRKDFSRAELHVCNIRHIQHHAAQLTLRLRLDANVDTPWVSSGWREF
ncbi:MAG: DinB family protein [Planctomycetes bacterium]|nr:DinB family protein [Planctomycetota bacterium]